MSRLALLLLPLLLASCNEQPETSEHFANVTNVSLCSGASARHVNADAPRRFPQFDRLYVYDVTMPADCRAKFLQAVEQRIGATCEPASGCSGNSSNGDFYRVEPLEGGFRVTYAT